VFFEVNTLFEKGAESEPTQFGSNSFFVFFVFLAAKNEFPLAA
jgi:hypothetical protein